MRPARGKQAAEKLKFHPGRAPESLCNGKVIIIPKPIWTIETSRQRSNKKNQSFTVTCHFGLRGRSGNVPSGQERNRAGDRHVLFIDTVGYSKLLMMTNGSESATVNQLVSERLNSGVLKHAGRWSTSAKFFSRSRDV
jgi:hypothetical protein